MLHFGREMKGRLVCGSFSSSLFSFYLFPPTTVAGICCSFQDTWHGKKTMKSDARGPQQKQERRIPANAE